MEPKPDTVMGSWLGRPRETTRVWPTLTRQSVVSTSSLVWPAAASLRSSIAQRGLREHAGADGGAGGATGGAGGDGGNGGGSGGGGREGGDGGRGGGGEGGGGGGSGGEDGGGGDGGGGGERGLGGGGDEGGGGDGGEGGGRWGGGGGGPHAHKRRWARSTGVTAQAAAFVPCWHFTSVPYTYGAPHDSQLVGSHLVCMSEHVCPAASKAVRTLSVAVRFCCMSSRHVRPLEVHASSQDRAGPADGCKDAR